MNWNKDIFKEIRTKMDLSQTPLAKMFGLHWKTIQNMGKGAVISLASVLALDKFFGEMQGFVSREEYNKVVAALNSVIGLNKKLTDNI